MSVRPWSPLSPNRSMPVVNSTNAKRAKCAKLTHNTDHMHACMLVLVDVRSEVLSMHYHELVSDAGQAAPSSIMSQTRRLSIDIGTWTCEGRMTENRLPLRLQFQPHHSQAQVQRSDFAPLAPAHTYHQLSTVLSHLAWLRKQITCTSEG